VARRATYFFDVHKTDSPRILVSGGWEYSDPVGVNTPTSEVLEQLSKAYTLLNYDVAFMGKKESELLSKKDITPDEGRLTSQEELMKVHSTPDGNKIAFIRFPSLSKGEDIPSRELIQKISEVIKREQSNADLLIGMSDWGWVGEREYIGQAPQFMPDILLGSGFGSGVTGRFDAKKRCVWYRPYDKGRTVVEVQVNTWPDRSKPEAWTNPKSIKSLSIGLGDKFIDNPKVDALFQ
jgi:hypothetical protein